MQNPNKKAQSDIRIKILNKLYYTLFNIPLIASQEVYYLDPGMAEAHDALVCIGEKSL